MALKIRTQNTPFTISVRDAVFEVLPLSVNEKNKIFRKHTKWNRTQRSEELNAPAASCEIFVNTVVNWKGIIDEKDKPVPCNQETKYNFFQYNLAVANEVLEKAEEDSAALAEETEKNSVAGQSGTSRQAE
jgi:hypothetical protein